MAQQARDEAGNIWNIDEAGNPISLAQAAPQGGPSVVAGSPVQAARQGADLTGAQLGNQKTAQQIALEAAQVPYAPRVAAAQATKAEADARAAVAAANKANEEGSGKTAEEKASLRMEALNKIALGLSLKRRSADEWFSTGFGSSLAGSFAGTNAYDLKQDTATLQNAGALQRIMEMSAQNGGKNPLTPLSNSDFQALSQSLSNLDPAQSDEQYQRNVQRVVDLYQRAYQGAGGTNLQGDLKKMAGDGAMSAAATPTATRSTNARDYGVAGVNGDVRGGPGGPGGGFSDAAGLSMAQKLSAAYNQGADVNALNRLLQDNGYQPLTDPDSIAAVQRRGPLNFTPPQVDDQRGAAGQALGSVADSPLGAYGIAAGDAVTAGTLDNLAGGQAKLAQEYAASQYPTASLLGTITGGTVASLGAELGAARAGLAGTRAALAGDAAYGAAYGAGSTDEGSRLLGAAAGGAGGALGGEIGRRGVDLLGRGFRGRFGLPAEAPVSRGQNIAVDALKADNLTPYEASAALREVNGLGVPSIPADLGDNARGAFSSLARQPGPERAALREAVTSRQQGQGDRIRSAITQDLGPITNVRQQSDALIQQGRTAASPFYEQAYQTPVPSTPELDAVLNTPFGRQAIGRARTIAANERRSPTELNFALDADGNPVMNPFPGRQVADDLAARDELEAAQAAYREARNGPGDVEAARSRIERARAAMRVTQQELRGAPDPNMAASVPTYTTQSLDYAKRGMDDILEAQRNPVTGKLVLDEAGRAQNAVRSQLLREVDRLNPNYGNARTAYAGPAAERDALALGRDAVRLSPEDVEVAAGRLTPTQRQQFALGYRTELSNQIDSRVDGADKVGALFGTPRKRNILGTVTGNAEGFGRFNQRLDAERAANETYRSVATGSPTASRLADDNIIGNDQALVNRVISAGQGFRTGGVTGGSIALALDALKGYTTYGLGKKAATARADAAANLLDPAVLAETAKTLGRNAAVRRVNDRAIGAALERPRRYLGLFGAPLLSSEFSGFVE